MQLPRNKQQNSGSHYKQPAEYRKCDGEFHPRSINNERYTNRKPEKHLKKMAESRTRKFVKEMVYTFGLREGDCC